MLVLQARVWGLLNSHLESDVEGHLESTWSTLPRLQPNLGETEEIDLPLWAIPAHLGNTRQWQSVVLTSASLASIQCCTLIQSNAFIPQQVLIYEYTPAFLMLQKPRQPHTECASWPSFFTRSISSKCECSIHMRETCIASTPLSSTGLVYSTSSLSASYWTYTVLVSTALS